MNRFFKYLVIFSFAGILFSCKDDKDEKAFLEIAQPQLSFDKAGGDKFVTVSTNRTFKATSNQAWCVPSVVTDKTTDNLQVSVVKNDVVEQRTAEVTVAVEGLASVKVTVTQLGTEAAIVIEQAAAGVILNDETSDFTLNITTNVSIRITLPAWIKNKGTNTPATGSKAYTYTATALTDGILREGDITVTATDAALSLTKTVHVEQTTTLRAMTEVFEKIEFGLKTPADRIDLVDFLAWTNSGPNMFSARVLQGVINKKQPRAYIAGPWSPYGKDVEKQRQAILKEYGKVTLNALPLDSDPAHQDGTAFWTLFKKYSAEIERMFVFSTNITHNDSFNVAAMLAGRNHGIAVSQELADKIQAEGYDIPQTNVIAYMGMTDATANYQTINEWIGDNMVEGANKTIIYAAVPRERGPGEKFLPTYYDLIVATDGLVYNAGYAGAKFQKKILDQFPDCTPIMGWADLSMELEYVRTVSECGKLIAGADWGYDNGSVWGAFPEYKPEGSINSAIPETYDTANGKIYVAFMMSDGDAWHFTVGSNIANFMNAKRGSFPMGWSTASLFTVANPLILQWYYETKTANDEFLQGPCGITYAYASAMPKRSYDNYLQLTKTALADAGLTMTNYWDLTNRNGGTGNALSGGDFSLIQKYYDVVKPDAITRGHNSPTGAYQMLGNCLVIEQVGAYWATNKEAGGGCLNAEHITSTLEYFRQNVLKNDAPLFLMVNVEAWGVGVDMVPDAIDLLKAGANKDKYEFVLPTQLVAAARTYEKTK